jgi:hypothetical protein
VGHDGTAFSVPSADIQMVAEENFAVGSHGTNIRFMTASLGSGTNTEKLRITANGNVGIGTSTPATKLEVVATGEAARFGDNTNTSTYAGLAYNANFPRALFGYDALTGSAVVQGGGGKGKLKRHQPCRRFS